MQGGVLPLKHAGPVSGQTPQNASARMPQPGQDAEHRYATSVHTSPLRLVHARIMHTKACGVCSNFKIPVEEFQRCWELDLATSRFTASRSLLTRIESEIGSGADLLIAEALCKRILSPVISFDLLQGYVLGPDKAKRR